jgi:hypothetical protein
VTAEFKRLGKDRAYRLGRLRTQGVPQLQRPAPFRPQFVRPYHRWPAVVWLAGLLVGVLLIMGGAAIGWWFMPFVIGLLAGAANWVGRWPSKVAVPAVVIAALVGWAVPLAYSMARGQWYETTARITARQAGIPGTAAAGVTLSVAIAAAQAVVGYWLGRAITPRPARYLAAGQAPGHRASSAATARRSVPLPSASVLSMNWSTAPIGGSARSRSSLICSRSAVANRPESGTWYGRS